MTTEKNTNERGDIMHDRTWKFHEGQIERIKAKDGQACALFVAENRKTINNMIFKYLREFPHMRAQFTGVRGNIDLDLFYNQLILDLPYLAFNNGGALSVTMYRDSICKASIGFEYIMTDAAKNGNKLSSLYYQYRYESETLFPIFYEDWALETEHGEESDRHPLDTLCVVESVAEEYNARNERRNKLDVEELMEIVSDLLNVKDRAILHFVLRGVSSAEAREELGLTERQYSHARERALVKLRKNVATVVARLLDHGSRHANLFVGVFPDGYSPEENEARRQHYAEYMRAYRARKESEESA